MSSVPCSSSSRVARLFSIAVEVVPNPLEILVV
jgi:hypothetical protein